MKAEAAKAVCRSIEHNVCNVVAEGRFGLTKCDKIIQIYNESIDYSRVL